MTKYEQRIYALKRRQNCYACWKRLSPHDERRRIRRYCSRRSCQWQKAEHAAVLRRYWYSGPRNVFRLA